MSKFIKTGLGVAVAVALLVGVAVPSANALTSDEIVDLLVSAGLSADQAAALALVLGDSSSSSSSDSCALKNSPDLTVGSTGANVTALQQMLEDMGYLTIPAGVSYGYFGSLTQSALASYQAAMGISPASGYFGPITKGSISCDSSSSMDDDDDSSSSSSDLDGGAGSIQSTESVSGYANEEVGEDEEDVVVAGIEIEAGEESDIEITAIKLNFDKTSSGSGSDDDLEDYASEVAIWFDGEKVAEVDADEFDDDNNYSRTVTLDSGVVIDADETEEVLVSISGVSNLDSSNEGETWTVDFETVRFRDAQGAVISDTVTYAPESFSFESFSSASDIEFKIQSGDDDINDSRVIQIDDNDKTDNVDLFSFDVKLNGDSDVTIDDLPISSTLSGGAMLNDFFSKLSLEVDGDEISSENPTASTTVVFDDLDLELSPGSYEFVLVGEIKATSSGSIAVGDTALFTFGESETDRSDFDIEDENGDNLSDSDKTGTESTETHSFFVDGIDADFVSEKSEAFSVDSTDNDRVELTMVFDVENFGDDELFIPNSATLTVSSSTAEVRTAPSTSEGVGYALQFTGTTSIAAANVSHTLTSTADSESNSFSIKSGDTERFTLKVIVTNKSAAVIDGTNVRALLAGINWAETDSATGDQVYTTDLNDFETGYAVVAD